MSSMIERIFFSSNETLLFPARRCFSIDSASPSTMLESLRASSLGTVKRGMIGRSKPGLPSKTMPSVSASVTPVMSTNAIPAGAERKPPPIFGPILPLRAFTLVVGASLVLGAPSPFFEPPPPSR